LLIHLGLHFNSNQILKDYELPYVDGAQYIYLLFISYERRTVGKTADVRIVFSQHLCRVIPAGQLELESFSCDLQKQPCLPNPGSDKSIAVSFLLQ
jgi:hypothetical protein